MESFKGMLFKMRTLTINSTISDCENPTLLFSRTLDPTLLTAMGPFCGQTPQPRAEFS